MGGYVEKRNEWTEEEIWERSERVTMDRIEPLRRAGLQDAEP